MWVHVPLLTTELVARLSGLLVFLYRRPIVAVALLAGAVVNLWMLLRWGALGWDWNPARVAAGAAGAALFLVSNLVHELGHATALRSRGERPGAIGIGMYYLFPVFYCDVSSAWRVPPRQRISVDLGGIYFHLLFTFGLGAGFALTGSEILLWTAVMVNLSMVSNLNPFLRFDGYWLMADISGVRDLRGSTRAVLRRMLRREPGSVPESGNRWLYAYALGSCLYFLGLTVYIAWRVLPGVLEDLRHADHLLPGRGGQPGDAFPAGLGEVLVGIVVLTGVLLFLVVGARSLILLWRTDRAPRHD
jgi:putative peptide zinc metalloprotease protein